MKTGGVRQTENLKKSKKGPSRRRTKKAKAGKRSLRHTVVKGKRDRQARRQKKSPRLGKEEDIGLFQFKKKGRIRGQAPPKKDVLTVVINGGPRILIGARPIRRLYTEIKKRECPVRTGSRKR